MDAVFNDSISGPSSGILVLSPKSGSSGYYVHTVEAVNATVVKINDTSWIYSNATGPVMLTVYSTLVSERGVQSLYITGVTGDSTGVRVRIDPSTIAGLPEGRFSVRGIAYQTFDNGFVGYANIATDKRTIMEGTEICDVVMSGIVDPGFRLYYAYVLLEYGTYDVSNDTYSNEQVSVAIMAPAVV